MQLKQSEDNRTGRDGKTKQLSEWIEGLKKEIDGLKNEARMFQGKKEEEKSKVPPAEVETVKAEIAKVKAELEADGKKIQKEHHEFDSKLTKIKAQLRDLEKVRIY